MKTLTDEQVDLLRRAIESLLEQRSDWDKDENTDQVLIADAQRLLAPDTANVCN